MRSRGWTILIAACMLACVRQGAAQQAAPGPQRSTLTGVFTPAQAARGKSLYGLKCRSCHTPEGHSATIKSKWAGQSLSDIFQYIAENMPKNDPGSLDAAEDAQALAYLLQATGMPSGSEELPADSAALSKIRFDTLAAKPGTTAGETRP